MRRVLIALAVLSLVAAACVQPPGPIDEPPPADDGAGEDSGEPPATEPPTTEPPTTEPPADDEEVPPEWLVKLREAFAALVDKVETRTAPDANDDLAGDIGATDPALDPADAEAAAVIPLPGDCNPLGIAYDAGPDEDSSCALPWPSDLFRSNGMLSIPDALFDSDVLSALPDSAAPSQVFDGADGYTPISPVLFELPEPVDVGTVPPDGGDTLIVWDVATGERVPVLVDVDSEAANHGTADTIVRAWPRTSFEFGHRYLAVLTTALGSTGSPYVRTPGAEEALGGPGTPLGAHHEPLLGPVDAEIGRDAVLSLTDFTIRSEADAVGDIESMVAAVDKQAHPVTIDDVGINLLIPGAVEVRGRVQLTDFRDANGEIHHQPGDQGTPIEVPFLLSVPTAAADGPVPVAVYGHGIALMKWTYFVVAPTNAKQGVATIAIDQPNHGDRIDPDDPNNWYVANLTAPEHVGRLTAMMMQSQMDHASLLRAIETELTELDVQPFSLFGDDGDGVADLDTTRIIYEGTSLGGVLGTAVVAMQPRFDAMFLQVAGAGVTNLLRWSLFWDFPLLAFADVIPSAASPGEAGALLGLAQQIIDGAEALTAARRLASDPRPFGIVVAHEDEIVPNYSSERLIALAGLPLYGPVQWPIPWLPAPLSERPADGRGAFQIDPSTGVGGLLAHVAFLNPEPMAELAGWLEDRFPEQQPEATTLSVKKVTEPAGGGGFEFKVDDGAPFTLDDGGSETFENVEPGAHTVVESDPGGDWELAGIRCEVDGLDSGVVDLDGGSVTLDLRAGEDAECTFANGEGEVEVEDTPPAEPPADSPADPPADPAGGTDVAGSQETSGGELPFTGMLGGWLLAIGLVLLAGGIFLWRAARARRATTDPRGRRLSS